MKTTYKDFLYPSDVDNWVKTYKNCFPSANNANKEFIDALSCYTGSVNTPINNALRYGTNISENTLIQPIYQQLIDNLPTYHIPENIIVYRYISKGLLKVMCPSYPPKAGMIIQDKGFMSTTLIKNGVDSLRESNTLLKVLLKISVPAGTKGTYVGQEINPLSEYEVILAPNTQLRIDYKKPFSKKYFECTVIN